MYKYNNHVGELTRFILLDDIDRDSGVSFCNMMFFLFKFIEIVIVEYTKAPTGRKVIVTTNLDH